MTVFLLKVSLRNSKFATAQFSMRFNAILPGHGLEFIERECKTSCHIEFDLLKPDFISQTTESPRHFPMEYIGSRTCNKAGVILLNAVRRISEQAWPLPCRGSLLDKAVHLAHFRHPDICTLSHRNIACIGWHIVSLPRSITIPQMVHHREHWCPPTSSYECSWGRSTHVLPLLDLFYYITCSHGPYIVPLWTLGYVEKPYSLDAANFCLVYVDIIFGLINHYYHLFSPFY